MIEYKEPTKEFEKKFFSDEEPKEGIVVPVHAHGMDYLLEWSRERLFPFEYTTQLE